MQNQPKSIDPEWTILKLLNWTTSYFKSHDIDSPRATAEILLAHIMKLKRITKWADINMVELDLPKLITHFAQSNKAEGKSLKTVFWYSDMLNDFAKFLQAY